MNKLNEAAEVAAILGFLAQNPGKWYSPGEIKDAGLVSDKRNVFDRVGNHRHVEVRGPRSAPQFTFRGSGQQGESAVSQPSSTEGNS